MSAPMLGYFYARTPQEMQGRSAAIMTVAGMGIGAFAPLVSAWLVAANQQISGFIGGGVLMGICAVIFFSRIKCAELACPKPGPSKPKAWQSESVLGLLPRRLPCFYFL
ncbi:hypothetical protein RQN30_06330 [Arcanobacterium hippocoleae]